MVGCMYDSRFHVLSNSILVISGRWMGENEKLCAMGPRSRLKRFAPPVLWFEALFFTNTFSSHGAI